MSSNSTNILPDFLAYDPSLPKPYWHQHMELACVCVFNGLSVIVISARTLIKFQRLKKLRVDDFWMLAALFVLIFPLWFSQIGANVHGHGLHNLNTPPEETMKWWRFSIGFCGYYVVTSLLKISVCSCLLQIVPEQHKVLRATLYSICVAVSCLGLVCTVIWIFPCRPISCNFDYTVKNTSCLNLDYMRYAYCALGIVVDLIICWIPFQIIRQTVIQKLERRILLCVFVATFLGTIACAVEIYGIYTNRYEVALTDTSYNSTPFLICNDVEIFMYALGATFPAFSPWLISRFSSTRVGSYGTTLPSIESIGEGVKGSPGSRIPISRKDTTDTTEEIQMTVKC